jgi:hypothetical protein
MIKRKDDGSSSSSSSSSETTPSSTDTADEWAPPRGSKYVELARRVHGGGAVPWASGIRARANAVHDSAVATRDLDAAQEAMAQAYDALFGAMDAEEVKIAGARRSSDLEQSQTRLQMLRDMLTDCHRMQGRIRELLARVESDPYHEPPPSWHAKSRLWAHNNTAWGP